MDLSDQMGKLTLIMNILKNLLKEEGASEEKVAALVRQLYKLTAYDFSDEAVEERSWLIQRLEELDGERYEKALGLLHERGQRLGGKHGRAV